METGFTDQRRIYRLRLINHKLLGFAFIIIISIRQNI